MTALITALVTRPDKNKTGLNPDVCDTKSKMNESLSLICVG